MELKVDKDRVLKAAEKCPQAKGVLEELYPEAFELGIDFSRFYIDRASSGYISLRYKSVINGFDYFVLTIKKDGIRRDGGLQFSGLPLDEKNKIKILD